MDHLTAFSVTTITVMILYHVLTLPSDTFYETKIAKTLGFVGCLILSLAVIVNTYVVHFFEYHYSFLVLAFVPMFIYSLLYQRDRNDT